MYRLITIVFFVSGLFAQAQESPDIIFSPLGGVYKNETTVSIDAGDDAIIYYSLDGSIPGLGSTRYNGPITIRKVALIRAVGYKGGRRTEVVTQTYVCDRNYDLPIVSLATEPGSLWDPALGIYVEGCCADTIEPHLGANYWMDWERPANIEMFDENGALCFNQPVGISIFGGFSRILPQKSIAIFARKKYGNKRIRYTLFPERNTSKYKSFILRNSGGDFKRTHLRDAFMTQLAKPTGLAIQAYRPAVLFINGKYWGIQNLREKINEHYLKANFGVDKNNVDILRQNGVRRHGYSANYKKLLAYFRKNDLAKDDKVRELRTFMDIDDYIRYNIAEVYSDNRDAGGNIRYWRERNDSAKWRWIYYDLDQGLGNNAPKGHKRNTLKKFTSVNDEAWPDPPWSTVIIRSLLKNKELERQYINMFADHLNTVYHPDTANRLLDRMIDAIDYEMTYHQRRWGSTYENWEHHISVLRKFIKVRPYYCRAHLMRRFDLKDTVKVDIIHPGQDICQISFNSLGIGDNFSGVYFKNVPVQIQVEMDHDYELLGWKDLEEGARTRVINPKRDLVLEPIVKPRPKSKFTDSVLFYEIAFFEPEVGVSLDWLELYNNSRREIDLGGWKLTDRHFKDGWKVPLGIKMEPESFLILTRQIDSFRSSYPMDSIPAIGNFRFGLSGLRQMVKLYDSKGYMVDSINYGWMPGDDSDSLFTMSLVDPDSSFSNRSWKVELPTPGGHSHTYRNYLQIEADKRYWTMVLNIVGGSLFFILVAGSLFFHYFRRKRKKRQI